MAFFAHRLSKPFSPRTPAFPSAMAGACWRPLAKQDIDGAVSFVAIRKRDAMRHDWTVLADHLGEIANLFSVPLQLTDGQGFRVIPKSADPLPMGEIQFPLEVEFIWETDQQWYIKKF